MLTIDTSFIDNISGIFMQRFDEIAEPAYLARKPVVTEIKDAGHWDGVDTVTAVDKAMEVGILGDIQKTYGDDIKLMGEENFGKLDKAGKEAALLANAQGMTIAVDPLDGTNPFKKYVNGETDALPHFGTMAVLFNNGIPIIGWDLTYHDGKNKLAYGGPGFGTYILDLNTDETKPVKLQVPQGSVRNWPIVTTVKAWPATPAPDMIEQIAAQNPGVPLTLDYQAIIKEQIAAGEILLTDIIPMSAAHETMFVLDGTAVAAPWRQTNIWDHMAAVPLARGAGGFAMMINGGTPTMSSHQQSGIIMGSDEATCRVVRNALLRGEYYNRISTPALK